MQVQQAMQWQPAVIFGDILEDLRVVGEGEENLEEIKEMVMLVFHNNVHSTVGLNKN